MICADDRVQVGLPRDDRELEQARAVQVLRVAAQAETIAARRRMTPAPAPAVSAVQVGKE